MVIERYGLEDQVPRSVLDYLRESASAGHDGESETPKPGDPIFDRVCTEIIASNELAASAAAARAKELGFNALLLSTFIEGEAREVGSVMAGIAREVRQSGRPVAPPACIVAGGETTVTVRGDGQGGRNQELALAAALAIEGLDRTMIVGLATDGTDGPTDAAGARVDGSTVRRGEALGLSAAGYLANNDAYNYFRQLDDLIITGPTNTNVNDLILILVW
jgi:hydroxypyruvate reductase